MTPSVCCCFLTGNSFLFELHTQSDGCICGAGGDDKNNKFDDEDHCLVKMTVMFIHQAWQNNDFSLE